MGAKIIVPTINGNVAVKIPAYASSGEKLRLKGKGLNNFKGTGDQIMTIKIISPRQKNSELEQVLKDMPNYEVRSF